MNKILFFGYGAYRSKSRIQQVTEEDPGDGIGAILENYRLAYQDLSQIPSPVREELEDIWGPKFKAYTAVAGKGIISGLIWKVSEEAFATIKEWEYVGVWRELLEVTVKTADGLSIKVFTDKAPDIHPVEGYVDGLNYNEFAFRRQGDIAKIEDEKYYTNEKLEKIRKHLESFTK